MGNLLQPSFAKGEVQPELFGRVDTAAYKVGLATARNVIVRTTGGVINRPGLQFIGPQISMSAPSRLRRFRFNVGDSYLLEFGAFKMRVIRNDAPVLEAAKAITGITLSNPAVVNATSHGYSVGDDVEFTVAGMGRLNGRRMRVGSVPDANHFSLQDIITGGSLDSTGFTAFTSGTAARVFTLATPYAQADLKTLKFVQSADVVTITHPSYPEAMLGRLADDNWTLTNPTFTPSIIAPTGLTGTANVTGPTTLSYCVTATSAANGEESLASASFTITNSADPLVAPAKNNTLSWSAVDGAVTYSVYLEVNGVFGFVGYTPALTFTDDNMSPDLATTPPTSQNPFVGAGNYPATSTYYQQRHVRGGSSNAPDQLNYSRTANFYSFSTSVPSQADDAIQATLTSREVNAVKFMVPARDLLVFTAGGEWRINSTTGNGFSTSTMQQLPQSTWGCSDFMEPIVVGLTVLFVPENQISVRSFSYTYISDAYQGNDVTLMSQHLFQQYPLVDWGYSRAPDPVIYGVRADGQATAFTWQEEQQVSAWTRWDTLGSFEAVDVVRPTQDQPDEIPYFGVARTVNGRTVRYIERMASRRFTDVRDCFFVDCGLSLDEPKAITGIILSDPAGIVCPGHGFSNGDQVDVFDCDWVPTFDDLDNEAQPDQLNGRRFTISSAAADSFVLNGVDATDFTAYIGDGTARKAVQTVAGLDHLEGATVQALVDGNVVSNLVVRDGAVTMPFKFSRAHVGLKYISDVGTLDLESPQGTIQGLFKRVVSVTVRFNNSRGLFIGQDDTTLEELKQREFDLLGDPTALFSGDKVMTIGSDWNADGRVFLRQRYPLPMDILAIIPNLDIEG